MKNGRLQCKDFSDGPIMALLRRNPGKWHGWWKEWEGLGGLSVRPAFPSGTPDKLVLAKMRSLMARGLVNGCGCGCRGDFHVGDGGYGPMKRRGKYE